MTGEVTTKILLIDDEPALLELGEMFLETNEGFEVETTESARDALARLEGMEYDAVISDYQMPEMDGIELLKTLRSEGVSIPFVLFTGKGREEVVIEALNNGADFYVNKGGDPKAQFAELANMVKQAVARKRAEEAIRKSEERYRTTLQGMLEGCQIIGTDWRYIYLNDAAIMHARRPREELIGRTMMDSYPGIEKTRTFQILKECMETRARTRIENRFEYTDGSWRWFDLSVEPVPEGIFVLSMDVTERKESEEILRRSEEHFRSLIENATDMIAVVDYAGTIKFLSPSVEVYLGFKPEELVGRNVTEIVHPDDIEHSLRGVRKVATGDVRRKVIDLRLRKKDGSWCPIEAIGSKALGGGSTERDVVVNARDVTERINARLKLEHLNRVLRAIHDVNMLIVKERDRDVLLQEVVDNLVNTRGFYGAWILILDGSGRPAKTYGAGLGERMKVLESLPVTGTVPNCVPRALTSDDLVISHSRDSVCSGCIVAEPNPLRAVMTARLRHRGRDFGLIHVSIPAEVADVEDRMLMEELAGDISYALYNIETEWRMDVRDGGLEAISE